MRNTGGPAAPTTTSSTTTTTDPRWATGLAFSVSLGVEVAQLVLPISRAAEVHDIVFNTFGGFIGALGATFLIRLAEKSGRHTGELSQRSTAGESTNPYKPTLSAPPSENR